MHMRFRKSSVFVVDLRGPPCPPYPHVKVPMKKTKARTQTRSYEPYLCLSVLLCGRWSRETNRNPPILRGAIWAISYFSIHAYAFGFFGDGAILGNVLDAGFVDPQDSNGVLKEYDKGTTGCGLEHGIPKRAPY